MKTLASRLLEQLRKDPAYSGSNGAMLKAIKARLPQNEISEVLPFDIDHAVSAARFLDIEKINGLPVGFIMLQNHPKQEDTCLNVDICVIPEYRKKGIATKMARKAIKFFVNSDYDQLIWSARISY